MILILFFFLLQRLKFNPIFLLLIFVLHTTATQHAEAADGIFNSNPAHRLRLRQAFLTFYILFFFFLLVPFSPLKWLVKMRPTHFPVPSLCDLSSWK